MANRVIRDWTDSERVNDLSFEAEVLFLRICMKADDYGSYHGNVRLIKSLLFPLKADQVTETDVARWLGEIRMAGLISFYDAEGKQFIRIWKFNQRMRTMKKRFPDMPEPVLQETAADCGGIPQVAADCLPEDEKNRREVEIEGEDEGEGECEISPSTPPIEIPEQHQGQKYYGTNQTGGAENFGDIPAIDMYISSPVAKCYGLYTESTYFHPAREQLAMKHHMDEDILKDWCSVFVAQLTGRGELQKTLKDFASHFSNWMPKQDFTKTPKQALDYEQQNSNTGKQSTKSGRASPQSFYNAVKSSNNNR